MVMLMRIFLHQANMINNNKQSKSNQTETITAMTITTTVNHSNAKRPDMMTKEEA